GAKILREKGYPEEVVRAILSHADYTGVTRDSQLEKTLFACDELAGFITACSYVRPSKSVLDLEASSVKKRMKDKAFARGVNRQRCDKGREKPPPPPKTTLPLLNESHASRTRRYGARRKHSTPPRRFLSYFNLLIRRPADSAVPHGFSRRQKAEIL